MATNTTFEECSNELSLLLRRGCDFPRISTSLAALYSCEITYAERIAPYHTIACCVYSALSAILAGVTFLWFINAFMEIRDRNRQTGMQLKTSSRMLLYRVSHDC
jgi:hypothetical protein